MLKNTFAVMAAATVLAWAPLAIAAEGAEGSCHGGDAAAAKHEGHGKHHGKKHGHADHAKHAGCDDCAEAGCADCAKGNCEECAKGTCETCKKAGCEDCSKCAKGKCAGCKKDGKCKDCKKDGKCEDCKKARKCEHCEKGTKTASADASKIGIVTVDGVADLQKAGPVTFIDVNGENTRKKEGIVPGARLLSSSSKFDPAKELPSDKNATLVFYCANTRCSAAPTAAERASAAGYTNVHVMKVGIKGWKEAGKKTDPAPRS